MRFSLIAVPPLLLTTLASAGPEGGATPLAEVTAKIAALPGDQLNALAMQAFHEGRIDDLLAVVKFTESGVQDSILGRLPENVAQRIRQMMDELGEVNETRAEAGARAIEPMLTPPKLILLEAQALNHADRLTEAGAKYEEAFEAGAGSRLHYYSAACVWSRAGDKDAAFRNLDRAVEDGWTDAPVMQDDEDFKSLHDDPRWGKLVDRMKRQAKDRLASLPEVHTHLSVVRLPEPAKEGGMSVEEALWQRRSVRKYADGPLSLAEVSQLCWAAYGLNRPMPNAPARLRGGLKTAPSAGALYPLEIYLFAGNVTGLDPGIYLYKPETHELMLLFRGDKRSGLCDAAYGQGWIREAPASFVFSAVFERTTGRYGTRGRERYVCMDLGHSAENICLQCPALGLGTVPIGAFQDDQVKLVTGMTKEEEALYIMPVGRLEE
jgi:SagB-type dehydrogenase family enzyme